MNNFSCNLLQAKNELEQNKYVICLIKDSSVFHSCSRGVSPLVNWIQEGKTFEGFACADKVVGKAAAMLMVLLGINEVYAPIMSKGALEVFEKYSIPYFYDALVERIFNRTKDDFCPMDKAVFSLTEPTDAYRAICNKLAELSKK